MATGSVLLLQTYEVLSKKSMACAWPTVVGETAEASPWDPRPWRGRGFVGLLWGQGRDLASDLSRDAVWSVGEVEEYAAVAGFLVKAPRLTLRYVGPKAEAVAYIVANGGRGKPVLCAEVVEGDGGVAVVGQAGKAVSGNEGISIALFDGVAVAGNYGTASAGSCGLAEVGNGGIAEVGECGRARAGEGGILSFHTMARDRDRIVTAYVGEAGILPNVWYECVDGVVLEAKGGVS